jgi:5-methylcytosine-specific restriction enzyme B
MKNKYWHLQMHLPEGKGGTVIDSKEMLLEPNPIIGTGEWNDKQCLDFKGVADGIKIGDIVMVRVGNRPLALCEIMGEFFKDSKLSNKYINANFRNVKVLDWNTKGETSSLFSQGTLKPLYKSSNTPSWNYINNWYNKILGKMETQNIVDVLKLKKQIILQGAPGTGKTYTTAAVALSLLGVDFDPMNHAEIMQKYKSLEDRQIFFTTFHQSMDYEDFVEGLKPIVVEGGITYDIEDGIFKQICIKSKNKLTIENEFSFENSLEELKKECVKNGKIKLQTRTGAFFYLMYDDARPKYFWAQPLNTTKDDPWYHVLIENIKVYYSTGKQANTNFPYVYSICEYLKVKPEYRNKDQELNYILIIDEINRGNISKIFGELITLLESDKRIDGEHPLKVILPYSKEPFEVPSNLYIIGTMNTTDRSVGHIDYAVRRRFAFYTLVSNKDAINSFYDKSSINEKEVLKEKSLSLFDSISYYINEKKSPELDLEDLMVGHSYFMAKSMDELRLKLEYEIIPLLKEYEKDGIITLKELERKELGKNWKIILS